jgi:hypothetical protein
MFRFIKDLWKSLTHKCQWGMARPSSSLHGSKALVYNCEVCGMKSARAVTDEEYNKAKNEYDRWKKFGP